MVKDIRGSKVAVVGGAGFLGSHLVDHLIRDKECEVTVIDNLVAGKLDFVHRDADFIHHDITGSEEYLHKIFRTKPIQYVFNYAAYPYIPDSFERPLHISNVNFFGAIKVINAAHEAGVERTLQVSSAEIYGSCTQMPQCSPSIWIDEKYSVIPHSTYGSSKAAVDFYVQARWREAKVDCIALRQFNCYGPRETHPYIIPEIISQLAKQGPQVPTLKLGNDSFRDFMYATDAVISAVELLEGGQGGEVYNLGSSKPGISIWDLGRVIAQCMKYKDVVIEQDPARVRPWEIWYLQSCNDKINKVIKHRPKVHLYEGLKETITWFRSKGSVWPWEAKRINHT